MTFDSYDSINEMMNEIAESLNCEQTYNAFDDGKSRVEFLVWYFVDNDDFFADDQNYIDICNIKIEFYTRNKSSEKERKIQAVLKEKDITYQKSYSYLNDEKIYLTIYDLEVLINA